MNKVNGKIIINCNATKIWDALTNPEKILLYTGSHTETDWAKGSDITWSGEMHGTAYQNKGQVLEFNENKLLKFTYWSGMGGDADSPENYSEVTYSLNQLDNEITELTYSRINIATEIETQIFQGHIQSMLQEIKNIAEE